MSNTRRATGVPAGQTSPPDAAEDTIAQAIGMAVAFYAGQILEPMLAGIAERLDKLIAQQQDG